MDYMEFLEALVSAETEDERMELVKANAETFQPVSGEGSEEMQTSIDELNGTLEEANGQIATLKQEIKDRFFGKFKEDDEVEEPVDAEEPEEQGTATLKDLGFGNKSF